MSTTLLSSSSLLSAGSLTVRQKLQVARRGPTLPLLPMPSRQSLGLGDRTHEVRVYVAGATHLRSYLKPLGITAYKVGVTGRRSTWDRILDLRANRYGGLLRNEATHVVTRLDHADEWFQMPLEDPSAGLWDLPAGIRIERNTIVMTVSTRIAIEQLDDAIHAALAPRELRGYFRSEEGHARLIEAGYDPNCHLWTDYGLANDGRRPSAVSELYLIRPRREVRELVTCFGAIIEMLEHELGHDAAPAREL